MASDTAPALGAASVGDRERRRAVRLTIVASLIGTSIEWYDFNLYVALAALVFNKLYFPSNSPTASLLLAYGTLVVGFITRPIGGVVFGHFGDRIGRKPLLALTLTIMAVATFLIGAVPTYASIGVAAPIVLVALRLVQGFAMGGEWGGAVLIAYEFAPPGRRGLYACLPQIGFAVGFALSSGIVTLLSSTLSNEQFLAWGWRCAFFVSIPLLFIGLYVRLKLLETPHFVRARESFHLTKMPAGELLKNYRGSVVIGLLLRAGEGGYFTVFTLVIIAYLTGIIHLPRTWVLWSLTVASLLLIVTMPIASAWSDRVGHRRFFSRAVLVSGVASFPLLWMMQTGIPALAMIGVVLAIGVFWAPVYGPEAVVMCGLFPTPVRYTGVSLVYQFGSILFLAPVPFLATALLAWDTNQPWYLACYVLFACIVTAVALGTMRRSYD